MGDGLGISQREVSSCAVHYSFFIFRGFFFFCCPIILSLSQPKSFRGFLNSLPHPTGERGRSERAAEWCLVAGWGYTMTL